MLVITILFTLISAKNTSEKLYHFFTVFLSDTCYHLLMPDFRSHVLLIDDDPLMRRLFGSHLSTLGFEVIYASNGYEGWEFARKFSPECILLDINMPDINGIELASRLKNDDVTKHIPIAILTNVDLTHDAERALTEVGVLEYIHKGISKEDFLARMRAIVPPPEKSRE